MKYFVRILIVLGYIPLGLLWSLLMLIVTPINVIFLSSKFIVTGSFDKVFLEDDIYDKVDEYCDKLVGKIEEKLKKKGFLCL